MLTIRAMSDGRGYASRYLAQSDYYAEGEHVVGQWKGRGAEMLGLSGPVQTEDFEAVRQGLDPVMECRRSCSTWRLPVGV